MASSAHELFQLLDEKFDQVHHEILAPQLDEIEEYRRRTAFYRNDLTYIMASVTAISSILLAIYLRSIAPLFGGTIIFILFMLWVDYHINTYRKTYKHIVIPQLLKQMKAELTYVAKPNAREPKFTKQMLNNSGLIGMSTWSVKAKDGIEGYLGKTEIIVAKLIGKVGWGGRAYIAFDGIIGFAEYAEPCDGWLWIYPESRIPWEGPGNQIFRLKNEKFEPAERVSIGDESFDSIYRAYGSSPKQAEAILTPELMANLVALYSESITVAFTLKGSEAYVAIWTNNDYLEPNLDMPAADRNAVQTKLYELEIMVSIIEDLNV